MLSTFTGPHNFLLKVDCWIIRLSPIFDENK